MKLINAPLVFTFVLVFGFSFSSYSQGNGLNFDGVNDEMVVTSPSNLPLGNSPRTIEAWVNPSTAGTVLFGWGTQTTRGMSMIGTGTSGIIYFWGQGADTPSNGTLTLGTWNHIAFTYDGTTVTIYINGVFDTSLQRNLNTHASDLTFSRQPISWWPEYNGALDEVRIWDIALTETEIQDQMNCQLSGSESGLIAYYRFNEGTAGQNNASVNTATDLSGSGNNATLNNFALNGATSNWVAGSPAVANSICVGPPVIPTMSEWALILFGLIVLSFGVVSVMRWQKEKKLQPAI